VPSAVGRGDAHSAGEGGSAVAGHTWLQRQRVLHHEPHPSDGDIIELNCGGSVMVTSRSTLRQVCPVPSKSLQLSWCCHRAAELLLSPQ
jgi:hypothetical protein